MLYKVDEPKDPELQICPWTDLPAKECPSIDGEKEADHFHWHLLVLEQAGIIEQVSGGRWKLTEKGLAQRI